MEKFLDRPESFTQEFLRKEKGIKHFDGADVPRMRNKLRDLILALKEEQGDDEIPPASKKSSAQPRPEIAVVISTPGRRRVEEKSLISSILTEAGDGESDKESARKISVPNDGHDIVEIPDTQEIIGKKLFMSNSKDGIRDEGKKRIRSAPRPRAPITGRPTRALANGKTEISASPEPVQECDRGPYNSPRSADDDLAIEQNKDPPTTTTLQQGLKAKDKGRNGKQKPKSKHVQNLEESEDTTNDATLQSIIYEEVDAERRRDEDLPTQGKANSPRKAPCFVSTANTQKRPRREKTLEQTPTVEPKTKETYAPDCW